MSAQSVSRRASLQWLGAAAAGAALPGLVQASAVNAPVAARRLVSLSGA